MVYPDERKAKLLRRAKALKERFELMQQMLDKYTTDLSACDATIESFPYYDTERLFKRINAKLYPIVYLTGSLHI